ncbi:hypothetical protein Tco_0375383, partial [Tanacetum coccineum]
YELWLNQVVLRMFGIIKGYEAFPLEKSNWCRFNRLLLLLLALDALLSIRFKCFEGLIVAFHQCSPKEDVRLSEVQVQHLLRLSGYGVAVAVGRNSVLSESGSLEVINDGVTIAKAIELLLAVEFGANAVSLKKGVERTVLGLLLVVVYNAASKLDCNSPTEHALTNSEDLSSNEAAGHPHEDSSVLRQFVPRKNAIKVIWGVNQPPPIFNHTPKISSNGEPNKEGVESDGNQEHVTLWQELSECIGVTESQLGQGSLSSVVNANVGDPLLPLGTQRLLPFIKAFLVLCDKLQENCSLLKQDNACAIESKIKQSITSSSQS